MEIRSKQQILQRRKEIEEELLGMLQETESEFGLDDIKAAIYNEEESDDMMKVVAMFDRGGDASELENILELVNDAWNYFPHKIIGGLSPADLPAGRFKTTAHDEPLILSRKSERISSDDPRNRPLNTQNRKKCFSNR